MHAPRLQLDSQDGFADPVSVASAAASPRYQPSRRSLRGLDWFIFFLADVQTGFGPFIAVYLTTQKWSQVEIGLVLSIGGIVALLGQMPGGAIVDAARSKLPVAAIAISIIGGCALAYAALPVFPVVVAAATMHALASCVLGTSIVAISLGLVGPDALGERLGRNARCASLGNGVAAALMGACGYFLSSRAVFVVTFILVIPTLVALSRIRSSEVINAPIPRGDHDPLGDKGPLGDSDPREAAPGAAQHPVRVIDLLRKKPLLIFAAAAMLLQLANAAMLPLMAGVVTTRSADWATVLIAACIVLPQAIVALSSPSVGRMAQSIGRRPLLMLGFSALAIRGIMFALVSDPYLLVAVQVFDGVTAAVFAVMIPLTIADIAADSGHFNLAQGIVGTASGIGASLSTVAAGYVADRYGASAAFVGLAGVAGLGLLMIASVMPETRRVVAPATS